MRTSLPSVIVSPAHSAPQALAALATRPALGARPALAAFTALVLAATFSALPASAAITCQEVGGTPGRETTVRIVIDAPDDGTVIPARNACGSKVVITGTYLVDAPPLEYDFYIVLDTSGSTTNDSGADVNRNGVLGEPADNIYQAEIQAAQDFINALDPAASRVALISFAGSATLRHPLTEDLPAVVATLEAMKSQAPSGGTNYVPAMEAMRLEMVTRGDMTNRLQRGIFLSDGEPNDSLTLIEAKATELAGLGMVMDTFGLGPIFSTALRQMAAITRGQYTALDVPGDIVDLLPSFVPDLSYTFDAAELGGEVGLMTTDEAAGTFEAVCNLHPGLNVVTLTLTSLGTTPVTVECVLDLTVPEPLSPDAGPEVSACAGETATVDASASTSVCFTPIYRWLDCVGAPLSDWSVTPRLDVEPCALPCETLTLEMSCENETCSKAATTVAACLAVAPPLPALASSCALQARLDCGVTDPSLDVDWDLDPLTDSDGDGDPTNDADAAGCEVVHDFASAGERTVVAWVSNPASGCVEAQPLTFTLDEHPAPRNIDGGTCPGVVASFSCGTPEAGSTYWWDFDATTDSDSNGNPLDDADEIGCDVSHLWLSGGTVLVHGWSEDADGCRRLVSQGTLDVSDVAIPGEARDLRVSRTGDALTFRWTAVPGSPAHRVLRGSLLPLHADGLYDHAADDAASRGACTVLGLPEFTDPDDAAGPEAYYYLVTGLNDCGGEGPTGEGWDRVTRSPRPARVPTPSCP